MNNENNITQSPIEAERKALDATVNILLVFLLALVAFAAGHYAAMREASELLKIILN